MKKLLLLMAATLLLTACPSTPYGKAVKTGLDITDTLHTGADTVDKLRLSGTLTVDEERSALTYMKTLNHLDTDVYGPCVQAAHLAGGTTTGFIACAQSFAASVNDPQVLNELHISNPQSQQKIQGIGQAISNLLQTLITALGGK